MVAESTSGDRTEAAVVVVQNWDQDQELLERVPIP